MRELTVKACKIVLRTSSDFLDIVRWNQEQPWSIEAQGTTKIIADKTVTGACWKDDQVAIMLDACCALHVIARADDEIAWQVVSPSQYAEFSSSWASNPERIRLIYFGPDGSSLAYEMDRAKMVAWAVGKEVRRLVASQYGPCLHFHGYGRNLQFHAATSSDDRPILTWHEEEE